MRNAIKASNYALFRSLAVGILLLLTVVWSFGCAHMAHTFMQTHYAHAQIAHTADLDAVIGGLTLRTASQMGHGQAQAAQILTLLFTRYSFFGLIVIMTAVYTKGQLKSGLWQIQAGSCYHKGTWLLAAFGAVSLQTLIMVIAFSVFGLLFSIPSWGSGLSLGPLIDILKMLALEFWLLLGIAALVFAVTVLTRSGLVGFLIGCYAPLLFWGFLCYPVKMMTDGKICLEKYEIVHSLTSLGIESHPGDLWKGIVGSFVCMVVCITAAYLFTKKRDRL